MNKQSFSYKSFIKNIYLELPNGYTFKHHSLENAEDLFLGRKSIKKDFLNILLNGQKRGAYLVTGYRGMGKTSFVRQVIDSYKLAKKQNDQNKHHTDVKTINISLAQTQVKEIDILKYIVNQLVEDVKTFPEYSFIRRITINTIFSWGWPLITITLVLLNYYYILEIITVKEKPDGINTIIENIIGLISLSGLLTLLLYTAINWLFTTKQFSFLWKGKNSGRADVKKIFEEITNLQLRCNAQITSEDSLRETFSASAMALFKKDTKTFPIASPREIEASLITILHDLVKFRDYIFVFDELDKVDATSTFRIEDNQNEKLSTDIRTHLDDLRERRHTITNILTALKFFINEAEARFIFIAGREMFEASLADISDRQASISSIFHRVIYVDSFLKDNSEKGNTSLDIGILVEKFLETIILPEFFINRINSLRKADLLSKYFIYQVLIDQINITYFDAENERVEKEVDRIEKNIDQIKSFKKKSQWIMVYYEFFRWFIKEYNLNYLQGKLEKAIKERDTFYKYFEKKIEDAFHKANNEKQQYIEARKVVFVLQNFIVYLVYRSNGSPRKMVKLFEEYIVRNQISSMERAEKRSIIIRPYSKNDVSNTKESQFIYFPYYTQYKLGFNSYLFQPLLIMYSSFIKRYSDDTLVSIPYLIDNLIKFHSTAFSIHNLELLPEILSTNKSPISRPFIEELVSFLGQNHIRRTETGIFEYKFYDKTHNEIMFISKIFEDEAAAYNFTLDENYSIKHHLIGKIKLLRESHRGFENNTKNPISSVIYLNRLLGDVRFQDEEYEDAIISYQDAIQMINRDDLSNLNLLISFIRIKLKLGLTYEKIKNYEFALGHYSGVVEECIKQLVYVDNNGNSIFPNTKDSSKKEALSIGQTNIYRELMFFILQAHMAILYLQEKLYEGLTFQKIKNIFSSMHTLNQQFDYSYNNRDIILASTCTNIGTILYYKNITPPHSINKMLLTYAKVIDNHKKNEENIPRHIYTDFRTNLEPVLKDAFPNIDIEFIMHTFEELSGKTDFDNTDHRVSSTSIIYYKYALKILLGVKKIDYNDEANNEGLKQKEKTKDGIVYLLKECPSLIYQVSKIDEKAVSYRSSQHRRYLTNIGHTLAKLGDAYLPLIKNKEIDIEEALGCFWYDEEDINKGKENSKNPSFYESREFEQYAREKLLWDYYGPRNEGFKVDQEQIVGGLLSPRFVLHIYYLSNLFFLEAGDTANGSFQLRKIIFTLRALEFSNNDKERINFGLECLENNLVRRILEYSSWMSHSSDRPQLAKYKKNFNVGTLRTPHLISHELYANLSNNSETKEAILSYTLLKIEHLIPPKENQNVYKSLDSYSANIQESKLISPYNSISHQISRMMELELQTNINFKILSHYIEYKFCKLTDDKFKLLGENSWESMFYNLSKLYDIESSAFDSQANEEDVLKFNNGVFNQLDKADEKALIDLVYEFSQLIINSVFNIIQILNIANIFGVNYIVSYSYIARRHQDLGRWLKFLHFCRLLIANYKMKLRIDEELRDLVGNQTTVTLDALTHYQIALQNYYNCLQMHKEGDSYSLQINNMMYLEDDYNDNLYHFGAALERLKINSGSIRRQIEKLKREINTANMHKYSAYLGRQ